MARRGKRSAIRQVEHRVEGIRFKASEGDRVELRARAWHKSMGGEPAKTDTKVAIPHTGDVRLEHWPDKATNAAHRQQAKVHRMVKSRNTSGKLGDFLSPAPRTVDAAAVAAENAAIEARSAARRASYRV